MLNKVNIIHNLTLCYFVMAFFEIIVEFFVSKSIICLLKPLLPLFLIIIYYVDSEKKNVLFIIALLLSSLTNCLFIPDTPKCLFYGIIVFTLHRIICIYLILSLQKFIDYIPIIIATSPFLLIFFYLFTETSEIPENSFYVIIIQNILISILTGIALASYVMNDSKQNSILLISALLFVMLQFVVFVEKYFLTNEYEEFFRPTVIILNALAFFSLYKYVVTSEKLNYNNGLA